MFPIPFKLDNNPPPVTTPFEDVKDNVGETVATVEEILEIIKSEDVAVTFPLTAPFKIQVPDIVILPINSAFITVAPAFELANVIDVDVIFPPKYPP
jgi:hypothetical protein